MCWFFFYYYFSSNHASEWFKLYIEACNIANIVPTEPPKWFVFLKSMWSLGWLFSPYIIVLVFQIKLNSFETLVGFVRVAQELQRHHSAKAMVAHDLLTCFVDIPPLGRRETALTTQILSWPACQPCCCFIHTQWKECSRWPAWKVLLQLKPCPRSRSVHGSRSCQGLFEEPSVFILVKSGWPVSFYLSGSCLRVFA